MASWLLAAWIEEGEAEAELNCGGIVPAGTLLKIQLAGAHRVAVSIHDRTGSPSI
jgi:hypothetical protein